MIKTEPTEDAKSVFKWDDLYGSPHVVLQIDGICFNVPKSQFLDASTCREDLFSNGWSDDKCGGMIYLRDDVKHEEFRASLKLLYPLPYSDPYAPPTSLEWIHILKLSELWKMPRPRSEALAAIQSCTDIPTVKKFKLAQDYHASDLQNQAFTRLVQRPECLTYEEAEVLGLDASVRLYWAREQKYKQYRKIYLELHPPTPPTRDIETDAVLAHFSTELSHNHCYSFGPIDLMFLAQRSGVRDWLQGAFVDMVLREASLEPRESQRIGLGMAYKISVAREASFNRYRDLLGHPEIHCDYRKAVEGSWRLS